MRQYDGYDGLRSNEFRNFDASIDPHTMSLRRIASRRMRRDACLEPLPAEINSTQPGGGVCYSIELAWGRWRRWYLQAVSAAAMSSGWPALRHGDPTGCPHEILDPRDLKFCRNQTDCHWDAADDPFRWRERIPFARWGLAELQLMGWPLLAITVAAGTCAWWYSGDRCRWRRALLDRLFFSRSAAARSARAGLLVAPADGKVVEITQSGARRIRRRAGGADRDFSVAVQRPHQSLAVCGARVIRLRYSPGRFISALNPQCAIQNECMWIGLEEDRLPYRRFAVRQIAGQVARRIVCDLRPGQSGRPRREVRHDQARLAHRTDPAGRGLAGDVSVGQRIRGRRDVIGAYT